MRDWIGGIAAWLSQGLNKVFLNGSPDMTVSARCYINRERPGWRIAYRVINRVFFWQEDHCRASYETDLAFAKTILQWDRWDSCEDPLAGEDAR